MSDDLHRFKILLLDSPKRWILPFISYTFVCYCSYLESHSENFFGVGRPTQDGHADNILSEVYGAIAVLDKVTEGDEISDKNTRDGQCTYHYDAVISKQEMP